MSAKTRDQVCPVCGLLVDGKRGLSGHFRHRQEAGDIPHIAYQNEQEASKVENLDFVICKICGHRATHLKPVHKMSVVEYQMVP